MMTMIDDDYDDDDYHYVPVGNQFSPDREGKVVDMLHFIPCQKRHQTSNRENPALPRITGKS